MPRPPARFRITNVAKSVSHDELLEALTMQLALDDVRLVPHSLKLDVSTGGEMQVAEIELPHDEADLVRGPMRQPKVFIEALGITMVILFEELRESEVRNVREPEVRNDDSLDSSLKPLNLGSSPGLAPSGALLPPLAARSSQRPPARGSSNVSEDEESSSSGSVVDAGRPSYQLSRNDPEPERPGDFPDPEPRGPNRHLGAASAPKPNSFAGREGASLMPRYDGRGTASSHQSMEDDRYQQREGEASGFHRSLEARRPGAGEARGAPPPPCAPSPVGRTSPRSGEQSGRASHGPEALDKSFESGPEMAYCTRFLAEPTGELNGEPKLLRACTSPCSLQ